MNLKELQEQLIIILSETTPAEIFAGKLEKEIIPNFLKKINSSDKRIQDVLQDYIEKVSFENHNLKQSELQNLITDLKILEEKLSELNSTELLLKTFLKEFEKVFDWYSSEDYKMDYLYKNNEKLINISTELTMKFETKLQNILSSDEIKNFCDEESKQISLELNDIKPLILEKRLDIKNKVKNAKSENPENLRFFQNEELALEFFYKIFLNEDITMGYDYNSFKPYLNTNRCKSDSELNNLLKRGYLIPRNWRIYFEEILSKKIPNFTGENNGRFNKEYVKLSNVDYSYFLALKNAISFQNEIISENNEIFLAISGGMMVKISFSEKGSFVEKIQESEVEIYYQHSRKDQKLFNNVSIDCPNIWFILTQEFMIEISFEAAPVLFGSFPISAFAENISVIINKEKKEEKEKEEEEEQQRRDEEDHETRRKNYY